MAGRWRIVSLLVLLIPLAACGGGGASSANNIGSALRIESPEKGEKVTVPFTVELSSDVPLGQPGRQHHVQVYYDGVKGPVVTDERFRVTQKDVLGAGPFTIHVSLLTAEGTLGDSGDEVRVTVTGVAGQGTASPGRDR